MAPVAPVARHFQVKSGHFSQGKETCLSKLTFGDMLGVFCWKISPKVVLLSYYISYNRWVYFVVLLSYCMYNHPDFLREIRK